MEEQPSKRGDAAWKEQRDAVTQRNADAHKRSLAHTRTKDDAVMDRERRSAADEAEQLRALNKRIEKNR